MGCWSSLLGNGDIHWRSKDFVLTQLKFKVSVWLVNSTGRLLPDALWFLWLFVYYVCMHFGFVIVLCEPWSVFSEWAMSHFKIFSETRQNSDWMLVISEHSVGCGDHVQDSSESLAQKISDWRAEHLWCSMPRKTQVTADAWQHCTGQDTDWGGWQTVFEGLVHNDWNVDTCSADDSEKGLETQKDLCKIYSLWAQWGSEIDKDDSVRRQHRETLFWPWSTWLFDKNCHWWWNLGVNSRNGLQKEQHRVVSCGCQMPQEGIERSENAKDDGHCFLWLQRHHFGRCFEAKRDCHWWEICWNFEIFEGVHQEKRPELWWDRRFILHHDNVSPHTCFVTRQALQKWNVDTLDHPPYSPDLAPCNFALFPKLKSLIRGEKFENLKDLEAATRKILSSFKPDFFDLAIHDRPKDGKNAAMSMVTTLRGMG